MKTKLINVLVDQSEISSEPKRKQPNKATLLAITELEDGKGHKAASTTELFNELGLKLLVQRSQQQAIRKLRGKLKW